MRGVRWSVLIGGALTDLAKKIEKLRKTYDDSQLELRQLNRELNILRLNGHSNTKLYSKLERKIYKLNRKIKDTHFKITGLILQKRGT
jgi:septal ring factor EnvC (AmiA/AmiB activator)